MSSEKNKPLVSVVIPVYNGERFLFQAIESVLAQDYAPLEVIVVDDCSTDDSGLIAQSYPQVRYFRHEENQGPAVARNTGIAAAGGEYLAFLDSDDLWMPTKLSQQMEVHRRHPEIGYSIVYLKHFVESGMVSPTWMRDKFLQNAMPGHLPSALVVKRDVFERIGVFDPSYSPSEDSDWFFRAKDAGVPMMVVPETLLHRRIHNTNLTANAPILKELLLRVTRHSIQRQRRSTSEE